MRLDNNVNYNTKQSDIKGFADFVPKEEKAELTKLKDNSKKNEDDRANLPNNGRLKFNKVTKTWQKLSKPEIEDKLAALEKLKTFDEIVSVKEEYDTTNINQYFAEMKIKISEYQINTKVLMKKYKSNIDIYNQLLQIDNDLRNILHNIDNK